jgi:hypothetical protein
VQFCLYTIYLYISSYLSESINLTRAKAYQRDLDGDLEALSAAVDAEYEAWAAQVRAERYSDVIIMVLTLLNHMIIGSTTYVQESSVPDMEREGMYESAARLEQALAQVS